LRAEGRRVVRPFSPVAALSTLQSKVPSFCLSGKSVIGSFIALSSPVEKNISLSPSGKTSLQVCVIHPDKGRIAIVMNAGLDAVDAAASGMKWNRRAGFP